MSRIIISSWLLSLQTYAINVPSFLTRIQWQLIYMLIIISCYQIKLLTLANSLLSSAVGGHHRRSIIARHFSHTCSNCLRRWACPDNCCSSPSRQQSPCTPRLRPPSATAPADETGGCPGLVPRVGPPRRWVAILGGLLRFLEKKGAAWPRQRQQVGGAGAADEEEGAAGEWEVEGCHSFIGKFS